MVANYELVPASLPDSKAEIYGYVAIAGHKIGEVGGSPPSRNDRQHNADSFAFLAMGTWSHIYFSHIYDTRCLCLAWYLNRYKFINGNAVWVFAKYNPPPDNF